MCYFPCIIRYEPVAIRRKKRSHYQTGTWRGTKSALPVEYRSGWERDVCRFLEQDPTVLRFHYEAVVVPYLSNLSKKKVRKYFPDFLIEFVDGRKVLLEVKRKDKVWTLLVQKKVQAGEAFARAQGWDWAIWTNEDIARIRKTLGD